MKARTLALTAAAIIAGTAPLFGDGLSIDIVAPALEITDPNLDSVLDVGTVNSEVETLAGDLETEINNEIGNYGTLPLLTEGFANAGATAAHLGTQRAFPDYRLFALSLGTGAGIVAPTVDPEQATDAATQLEEDGDIYLGAAIQPITASLGVNLSALIPRTRVNVKVGYADIQEGTVAEGVSFSSLSVGVGANYQILRTRQLPLGFIRWRGLTLGSGLLYQQNETSLELEFDPIDGGELTFEDIGLNQSDIDNLQTADQASGSSTGTFDGLAATDQVVSLAFLPTLSGSVESSTYSIPLEATTGLRILWLFDFNLGAGIDLVFGNSEVSLGASGETVTEIDQAARDLFGIANEGSVTISTSTSSGPQFVRPRITTGATLNLGPVKLDVPVMFYFDAEGTGVMAGVNLGIVL